MLTLTECVEKQCKKPPTLGQMTVNVLRCPSCTRLLAVDRNGKIDGDKDPYCKRCGQKLDWRAYDV